MCGRWDDAHKTYRHTFFPLVYGMFKSGESAGAAMMIMSGLQMLAVKYFHEELSPGAGMMDHSSAFRIGYVKVFGDIQLGQCWPHLARKLREGKDYIGKTHEKAEYAYEHCTRIHLAHSTEMRDLLIKECGKVWACPPDPLVRCLLCIESCIAKRIAQYIAWCIVLRIA